MKKKTTKKVYKKQIKRKVRKRTTAKKGIFFNIFKRIKKWFTGGMKRIRKEQRHCLRFKKNKGKQSFCFVKALLLEYPRRTIISLIGISIIGLFVIAFNISGTPVGDYFGINLQTNLIQQLQAKIDALTGKIDKRKKCVDDKYWKPAVAETCNYWLYKQENNNCKKFDVPTERWAIGTKMCCTPLKGTNFNFEKENGKKVTLQACPGSDIFFSATKIHNSKFVPTKKQCGLGACLFYPADGFHVKVDKDRNPVLDENGNYIIEKDCVPVRRQSSCDRSCGGGKRTVYQMHKNCIETKGIETCNLQPCYTETN